MDPDTDDGQLVYEITTEPKHGFLESKLKPGNPITTFTQGTQAPSLSLLWPKCFISTTDIYRNVFGSSFFSLFDAFVGIYKYICFFLIICKVKRV